MDAMSNWRRGEKGGKVEKKSDGWVRMEGPELELELDLELQWKWKWKSRANLNTASGAGVEIAVAGPLQRTVCQCSVVRW